MKIGFTVGVSEQHQMELFFDQPSGDLRIMMDGTPVLHDSPSSPSRVRRKVKRYELRIGEREKHKLALQLTFEDEAGRLRQEEQREADALQLSFADQACEGASEECPDWPLQVTPRVSLLVTAAGD